MQDILRGGPKATRSPPSGCVLETKRMMRKGIVQDNLFRESGQGDLCSLSFHLLQVT